MSLKEQLLQDMKTAMKDKDVIRKDIVQIVRAGILQIEKDNKIEVDDDGVLEIISKEIKKRNDVMPDYERSGRQDLINDITRQLEILKAYLPEQLSEHEVLEIIDQAIAEAQATSSKDMGKVMKILAQSIKGKADNKLVSELVKQKLNSL